MLRVVGRRLLISVPLLLFATVISFVLVALAPGDAAREILGAEATPEAYTQLRQQLGLDEPLLTQYWHWLSGAVQGDLGTSVISNQPVTDGINQRLPVTISLIVGALLVAIPIGVGLGIFSAVKGGVSAKVLDSFALVGWALPSFWLGAVLIGIFAVRLHWLPAVGYVPLTTSPEQWCLSLILPVTALALHTVAGLARQTRESMMDSLSSEYVRLAAASGIPRRSIIFRHAFKNSAIRVLTILGLLVVALLGGTIFVETVFALPGVGGLATQATVDHDLPMIQGVVLYFTVIVIVVNLIIDLLYAFLDPRVKTS